MYDGTVKTNWLGKTVAVAVLARGLGNLSPGGGGMRTSKNLARGVLQGIETKNRHNSSTRVQCSGTTNSHEVFVLQTFQKLPAVVNRAKLLYVVQKLQRKWI